MTATNSGRGSAPFTQKPITGSPCRLPLFYLYSPVTKTLYIKISFEYLMVNVWDEHKGRLVGAIILFAIGLIAALIMISVGKKTDSVALQIATFAPALLFFMLSYVVAEPVLK